MMVGRASSPPKLNRGQEGSALGRRMPSIETPKINASHRRLNALVGEMRAVRASGDESRLVTLMQENDRLARELDALKDMRYGTS